MKPVTVGLGTIANTPANDAARVRDILSKARALGGLDASEVRVLLDTRDPELGSEILLAAHAVKEEIYGRRLVLFAPLYYSSYCCNSCLYCGFRRESAMQRRRLSQDEVERETQALLAQGHKRLLVIGGEEPGETGLNTLLQVIERVYATTHGKNNIRRVNVETAPLDVAGFKQLRDAHIGTYVLFQETYHRPTYATMHPRGPKADYDWRLTAMERAMTAGINDVGIGVLFGLYDHREEVVSLLQHARALEERFGVGPHTISVPRIEPAPGAPLSYAPPAPVSDDELLRIVAVLRLAVPYTGIILSTREPAALRSRLLELGVSQLSAGSRTEPGGYAQDGAADVAAQFSVGDHRSLDEVITDIVRHGMVPSFCTGCYRLGRTGKDFMDLAKPGLIKQHCLPNALLTFREYLLDFGSEESRRLGEALIREQVTTEVPKNRRSLLEQNLLQVEQGERDVYV
jgi:2-iminoacetate synthase